MMGLQLTPSELDKVYASVCACVCVSVCLCVRACERVRARVCFSFARAPFRRGVVLLGRSRR